MESIWRYKRNFICVPIIFGWPMVVCCLILWFGLNDVLFLPSQIAAIVVIVNLIWICAFFVGKP